jgi:hypothetical protein
LFTGLGRLHDESLVKCSGFRTGHGGLQLPENSQLFLKRDVGSGGDRADVFDGFSHLRPGGLEGRYGLSHGPGESLGPFHVGHIRHDRLEDAVPGGEGADHLLDAGLGGLGGERGHGGEGAHGFVGEARQRRLYVVGRADEFGLAVSGPGVGEALGGVLESPKVLDSE